MSFLTGSITDSVFPIAKKMIQAWADGNKQIKAILVTANISVLLGILSLVLLDHMQYLKTLWVIVPSITLSYGVFGVFGVLAYHEVKNERKINAAIEKVEENAREKPNDVQPSWELAKLKLETYLSRNLQNVRWIFFLTLFVCTAGFVLIGYGVLKAYADPMNFKPSIIAAISGIMVEFIAATFLVIYKSMMKQSRDLINVLERINAVGMSVQILESIENQENGLKNSTRAEIAKNLLILYSKFK